MHQFTCHSFADKPEFVDQMAEAAQDTWGHLRPGWEHADRVKYYQDRCKKEGVEQMLVAADAKGEFAGMAGLTAHDIDTRKDLFGWVADVYVKPQHRGLGLGTWLVAQVEAQAVAEGLTELYLYTPDAAEFYERFGWVEVEQTTHKGEQITIMRKDLAAVMQMGVPLQKQISKQLGQSTDLENMGDNVIPLHKD